MIPFSSVWLGRTWKVSITACWVLCHSHNIAVVMWEALTRSQFDVCWFHVSTSDEGRPPFFLTLWIIIRICIAAEPQNKPAVVSGKLTFWRCAVYMEQWCWEPCDCDLNMIFAPSRRLKLAVLHHWNNMCWKIYQRPLKILWIGVCYGHQGNMTELVPTLPRLASCGCTCLTVSSRV